MLLILTACSPWDLAVTGTTYLDGDTWDPDVAVATDGVYVRLPKAGALARVTPDAAWSLVDLDGASPERLVVTPDGASVLAFSSWPECRSDDPEIVTVEDCPNGDLSTRSELNLLRDGERVGGTAVAGVSGQFNAASFSPDHTLAALYLDFEEGQDVGIDGSLNLTEVVFVELETGTPHSVSVGFAAEAVVFSEDSEEAVVLSRNQVARISLVGAEGCDAYDVCVTYPLALDPDSRVQPSDVALVKRTLDDGTIERYAIVSVAGQSDVYVLDLTYESIDILDLSGVPSALQVDNANDRTVVVYGNAARVDTIEHEFFETSQLVLDEPMTRILPTATGMVLYNDAGNYHDVYWFDVVAGTAIEQRAENPVMEMVLAGEGYAVATMRPESSGGDGATAFYDANYGLGIFTLPTSASDSPPDPVALALQAEPVGLAIAGGTTALVLMSGVETLLRVDLESAASESVELSSPPLGIDAMPAGGFVVTQDSPLGLITFIDDAGELVEAGGFASGNLVSEPTLPRRNQEEGQ